MKEKHKRAPRVRAQGCLRLMAIVLVVVSVAFFAMHFLYMLYYTKPVQALVYSAGQLINFSVPVAKQSDFIAFSCGHGIFTVDPDGSDLRHVQRGVLRDNYAKIVWSPDGEWVAMPLIDPYAMWRGSEVVTVRFDGSRFARLTNNYDEETFVQWSADGNALQYIRDDRWLHRVSPDGENVLLELDTRTELGYSYYKSFTQEVSPHGKWFVATRVYQPTVKESTLLFYALDGTGRKWEWIAPGGATNVYWSREGELMTFDGHLQQFVLDMTTRTYEYVLDVEASHAAWSPTDRLIALATRDEQNYWGRGALHVLDRETGEVRRLIDDVYRAQISWSPDGQRIVFSGGKLRQLFTVRKDGSDLQQLTNMDCPVKGASWSPR